MVTQNVTASLICIALLGGCSTASFPAAPYAATATQASANPASQNYSTRKHFTVVSADNITTCRGSYAVPKPSDYYEAQALCDDGRSGTISLTYAGDELSSGLLRLSDGREANVTFSDGTGYTRSLALGPDYLSDLPPQKTADSTLSAQPNYSASTYTPSYRAPASPTFGCGGNYYGAISCVTGNPKTTHVRGYYRKDGTYVRSHYRSRRR